MAEQNILIASLKTTGLMVTEAYLFLIPRVPILWERFPVSIILIVAGAVKTVQPAWRNRQK